MHNTHTFSWLRYIVPHATKLNFFKLDKIALSLNYDGFLHIGDNSIWVSYTYLYIANIKMYPSIYVFYRSEVEQEVKKP